MRVILQRVSKAEVIANGLVTGQIAHGYVILLGVEIEDSTADVKWLTEKIISMRINNDDQDKMNRSITETNGDIMVISQFTLFASTKKGNRPSFIRAAKPETSIPLYEEFINEMGKLSGKKIKTGIFGADMKVSLVNDGPVTIILDSKNKE